MFIFKLSQIGALAQLGERYNGIVEVRGSIPLGSTKFSKSLHIPCYIVGKIYHSLKRALAVGVLSRNAIYL